MNSCLFGCCIYKNFLKNFVKYSQKTKKIDTHNDKKMSHKDKKIFQKNIKKNIGFIELQFWLTLKNINNIINMSIHMLSIKFTKECKLMNKTLNRVLSMVLTVFMLVSMLTVFAVAEAAPFATAYECAVTVEGVPQIANTALLVDTTITEDNGKTVTRKWDGNDYTFVVGTNAFKSLEEAYAYAKEKSIVRPDIIITGWTAGTDLVIEAESNVYSTNWNTLPMNEMGDMNKVGIKSNGEDWTENTAYTANETKIGSIIVKGTPSTWVGVYGFTITKYITLGKERSTGAAFIEYLIKNCKMDGVETNTNILTGYNNKDVNCKDVLTFQNFWLKSIGGTSDGASRFFGDNIRHFPHMVFDGLYIDFSDTNLLFKKANDHLKGYFANSSMTFKNSNMRRKATGTSPYWNLCQKNEGNATTRELYYDNNTLYNTNQAGGFIYITDGSWSTVHITNNFVVATTENSSSPVPLILYSNVDQGIVNENTYRITGNKLLGVKSVLDKMPVAPVPMFIEDNFTVGTVKETVDGYKEEAGEPFTTVGGYTSECSGSYIYDYNMKFSSKIKITEVEFGPDTEIEIGADLISIKCLGEQGVVTPVFKTNPDSAATGTVKYELSATSDFAEIIETVDTAKIAENKTATFYLRAYYEEEKEYQTVYQIKILAATPVDFNDSFMENGFDFAGKKFVFEDTAVFVIESELEDDGNYYGYGFLGETYYRFKVDNLLVFDTMSMLRTQMTGVDMPNILLPSGEYGKYVFDYPANYYGTNAGINPVDKSQSTSESGDDWVYDSRWGMYADTSFETIYFADGLEGEIYLDGMTVRGQINDTLRTMGKDGIAYDNLDITVNNSVIYHIRKNKVEDERDAGLIKNEIGTSTVDRVINLINKRSVNSNNSQIEFIENQYMSIEYEDFNKNYADSFTLKNSCVKDMRNAVRLFNDFVPANLTIDGLYMDFASLGETADNTIGYFKTGAAVLDGSFTLINSNIRNGNANSDLTPVVIEGPRGSGEKYRLVAGENYDVTINNNIFCNAVSSASGTAKYYITLSSTMVSSLEVKGNKAFQTGANAKKKGFIEKNKSLKNDYYKEADLLIIGNCDVSDNWFVGFDKNDAEFDIGLETNNPKMKNTFVSDKDDAHTTTGLTGIYTEAFGNEKYYFDYAKTVSSEDVLPIEIKSTTDKVRDVVVEGFNVTARIFDGGTLADIEIIFADGEAKGYWATTKNSTKQLDPSTITLKSVGGVDKNKSYYYKYTYVFEGEEYPQVYTVKMTGASDCTEHKWPLSGTYNNDATCQQNGTQVLTCSNKGCNATTVVEKPKSMVDCQVDTYVSNNDATCSKVGTETGKCIWCGTESTKENSKLYPMNKTVHNWGEWVYNNDATCCKDGSETRTCADGCGASQTQVSAEHLKSTVAHTWGEYTYDGTATCEKNGTKTAMCTVDGCRATNTVADANFPSSDKYHVWGEYVYNKDATTTQDGTQTATCEICGKENKITAEGTKLPFTANDSSKTFKDVKSAWYKEAVDYVTTYGFVSGVTKTEFGVGKSVTRGMFVTILARMAGVKTDDAANKAAATKFSDVAKGKYYAAAVKWANDNAIVSGTSATTFEPNKNISRQDLCVMVVNFAKFMNITLTEKEAAVTFNDASSIAGYAKTAVAACQKADIINGHTTGAFGPRDTATREQASQILYTLHNSFMAK